MPKTVEITPTSIKLEEIYIFFSEQFDITLGEGAKKAINDCREYLEGKLSGSDELVYGINTGFGSLCNVGISNEQTAELQYNLIVSHACGQGEVVPEDIARLILLLKIKNMSFGYSGVRLDLAESMVRLFNKNVTPVIYQQGSLGASGDLAPLAHMSLPLLGLGEVW